METFVVPLRGFRIRNVCGFLFVVPLRGFRIRNVFGLLFRFADLEFVIIDLGCSAQVSDRAVGFLFVACLPVGRFVVYGSAARIWDFRFGIMNY